MSAQESAAVEEFDVIVVGAGISGIGAGYHLQAESPDRSFVILEGREAIGGTWDLFRYPGIRSDSDMFTLGFSFKPWVHDKAIADGPAILEYLDETVREFGLGDKMRFGHWVEKAEWSTETARWTISVQRRDTGERVQFRCQFLFGCGGYYDYDKGYTPEFEGVDDFGGQVIHPQHWPENFDYKGKRIVVIGSGATAVTLVPAMAKDAAHVTMLQRSPTYIVAMPGKDAIAKKLRAWLPAKLAYSITRWKNILLSLGIYSYCRQWPERGRALLMRGVQDQLGEVPDDFKPKYDPWTQRLCLVPDGDLFRVLKKGNASIVTDHIDRFTEKGLRLKSGKELEADIIITATGLRVLAMAGIDLVVDGTPISVPQTVAYKGMMLSDVPNFAFSVGYTNASWTLKCDLTAKYVARVLNTMKEGGYAICRPRLPEAALEMTPILDLQSGYVQRAIDILPKQGPAEPWRVKQNYLIDRWRLGRAKIEDGVLEFTKAA